MRKKHLFTLLALSSIYLVSCKSGGKTGLLVPKDASVVIHINASSLGSKLSWNDIKQTSFFRDAQTQGKDELQKKLMDNPEASGIDTKGDLVFFMKKQGRGSYGMCEGSIKDAAAFEAFAKSLGKGAAQKDGEWSYQTEGKDQLVMWNKSKFAVISNMPDMNSTSYTGEMSSYKETSSMPVDSLKMIIKSVMDLKGDDNLDSDNRFVSLIKQEGDAHFWMNLGQLTSSMNTPAMSMMKFGNMFEGSISAATLNFDNGKIAIKAKHFYSGELAKVMEKNSGKPITKDLVNRIPSNNVVAAMVANCSPKGMEDMMKVMGVDGMANGFLGRYNLNLSDIIKAYEGKMVLAITDLQMKEKIIQLPGYGSVPGSSYTMTVPDYKLVFGMSVSDQTTFNKIIDVAKNEMHLGDNVSMKTTKDWFACSNNKEAADQFVGGATGNVPFADKITGHPFGLYIDLQKISALGGAFFGRGVKTDSASSTPNIWQDMIATGGEYSNGAMSVEYSINFLDKNTNSLKQLNKYFDETYAAKKNKTSAY